MREKLQQFVITCRFLPLNFFSCLISLNDIENLWTWTESSFYYIEYIYLWTYVSNPIVIFGSLEVHNIIPSALLLCIFCFFVVLVLHYGSNSFYLPVLPFELQERRTSLQSFPVIICDQFAGFNLTFRMTKGGFLEVLFALLYIYYGALVTVWISVVSYLRGKVYSSEISPYFSFETRLLWPLLALISAEMADSMRFLWPKLTFLLNMTTA